MFAASAGYERFMGRWSRLLAPHYIAFAGVKNGDRVLDVGTGTGSLAAAVEASMPASQIVGVDPSKGFIAYAQKNAKSTRVRYEVGDAQALNYKDASFDNTLALLVMNFVPDHDKAIAEMRRVTRSAGRRQCLCLGLRPGHADAQILLGRGDRVGPGDRTEGRAPYEAFPPRAAWRSLEEGRAHQCEGRAPGDRPDVLIV